MKTLSQAVVLSTLVGIFWGDRDNKPVDGTVDGIRSAMSNLLSNEAYAGSLDEKNNININPIVSENDFKFSFKISELNVVWSNVVNRIEWLNISLQSKKELLEKINEIEQQWSDRAISFYDKETNQEFSVTYLRWEIEIEKVGVIEKKDSTPDKWLKITHSADLEWKITTYEKDWKWFELKEVWNDAIITYFWFSGWHRDWEENLWVKSADRFAANSMMSGKVTNHISLWAGVKVWPEQLALLAFPWIDFGKYGQVVLFWENFRENNTFETSIWEKEARETQNKIALLYRQKIGEWLLNSVEATWSYKKWEDTKVFSEQFTDSNTVVIDTPESIITRTTTNTYELTWTNIRWDELKAILTTVLKLFENQKLTLWAQVTKRELNDWTDLGTDIGLVALYEAVIREFNKLKLGISVDDTEQKYTAWISRKIWDSAEIWVVWNYTNYEEWENNIEAWEDNYQAMLLYTQRFSTWWNINEGKDKGYKLFSKEWDDINEVAIRFAQSQASNVIDTPSKYVEEKKLVSSVTTDVTNDKPKPTPTPENFDAVDDNFSAEKWKQKFLDLLANDKNIDSIWEIKWLSEGCHADISGTWANFTWDSNWTCNFSYKWVGKNWTDWGNVSVTVSETPTPPGPELPLPTSSFASSSVTKTVWDAPFTNTFTTNSSWAVTCSTSAPAVATVNPTSCEVSVVWNWSATITANQAATASFKPDSDNFSLTVGSANTAPVVNNVTKAGNWSWTFTYDFWPDISDDSTPDSQLTFSLIGAVPSSVTVTWSGLNRTFTVPVWYAWNVTGTIHSCDLSGLCGDWSFKIEDI